jgi:hypothetical protein
MAPTRGCSESESEAAKMSAPKRIAGAPVVGGGEAIGVMVVALALPYLARQLSWFATTVTVIQLASAFLR